jgi:hypothetical protein
MRKFELFLRAFLKGKKEKMPKFLREEFTRDINVRVLFILFGIIFVIIWIFAFLRFQPSDYMVPVRYNTFLGVTQLGNWYDLYYVPVIMAFCALLNLVLANVIYTKDKMISYIFLGSNIFIAGSALAVVINLALISGI